MCFTTFAYPNAFSIEEANGVEPKQFWDNEYNQPFHKGCGLYEAFTEFAASTAIVTRIVSGGGTALM